MRRTLARHSRSALRDLRMYPLRTLLVALTLFVGTFAVILIAVAGTVTRDIFVAQEEMKSGRAPSYAAVIDLGTQSPEQMSSSARRLGQLVGPTIQWTSTVADQANVRVADPGRTSTTNRDWVPLSAAWVSGDIEDVRRLAALAGHWYGEPEQVHPLDVVLNAPAARSLGGPGTVIELVSRATDEPLQGRVVGVVADGQTEGNVYGRLDAAMALAPSLVTSRELRLHVHQESLDSETAQGLMQDVSTDLSAPFVEQPARVDSVGEIVAQLNNLQAAFLICAAAALVVAAIGILNIGLASVRERSRELTLRRALGARRLDLAITVVGSTVVLALAVSALGVGVAAATVEALPRWLPAELAITPPAMPWGATLVGLAGALATAVIGSATPAIIASRQDPADILRE